MPTWKEVLAHGDYLAQELGIPSAWFVLGRRSVRQHAFCVNASWSNLFGRIRINQNLLDESWDKIHYVLVHELCHLACPDQGHTKVFWREVGKYIPVRDMRQFIWKRTGLRVADEMERR